MAGRHVEGLSAGRLESGPVVNPGSQHSRGATIPRSNYARTEKAAGARKGEATDHPRALRRFLPTVLIVAVALLAYAPVLRAGFVWDDDLFLTDNPLIRASDGLYRFWFTTQPPDYFPLTSTMLWFEWRLWHLWGTGATGYHVVNVLLHAASALLLWRVLLRLKFPGSWLAGLLFAVHPVAVESVAWITERKNTLSMVLYLASILAWLRSEEVPSLPVFGNPPSPRLRGTSRPSAIGNYVLSLGLFLLALLAKTSVVILPAVLIGCVLWRRGRVGSRDFLRVFPFAALAAALGLVTFFYHHRVIGTQVIRTDGLAERAAGAGWAAWFYLYKALLPVNLCVIYPRWTTSASLLAFVPGLLFLGMLLLFARFRRSPSAVSLQNGSGPNGWGRPFLFALGYFLVALLPVLGFLNISLMRYSLVSDHWQYTALIGPVGLAAGLLAWVMERPGAWRTVAMAVAGALVLACAVLTWRQTHIYRDEETLWRDTLAKNPKASIAYINLGLACANAGRLDEAIRDYNQAIALKSDDDLAYNNRGAAYDKAGHPDQAIRDYTQAIALNPGDGRAHYNRGIVLAAAKRYVEAVADYDQAIALKPDYAEAYLNRGNVRTATNRYAEAIADCTRAIAIDSGDGAAYISRAVAYFAVKDYARAQSDVRAAERLGVRPHPDFLRALTEAAARSNPAPSPAP
jgi:tetratricopeptide (TPR) repeat protein